MIMMKKTIFTLSLLFALCACGGSDDDAAKDMTYPEIVSEGIVAVPTNCNVFKPGDVIPFNYVFKDDTELGSYNIEIHNNFDHHTSHSNSAEKCEMDEKQSEVSPWVYNQDYTIPAGLKNYTARIDIPIPTEVVVYEKDAQTGKEKGVLKPLQPGDYHFMIRLTDATGWQTLHAISIKVKN